MRSYDIYDAEQGISVGTLLYFEREKTFIIELVESLNEWTAPLLFTNYIKNGIFTIPREISLLWVKERIIPAGRQNIGMILREHKLEQYDEMRFLELSKGKCSQDALVIRKREALPDYVAQRMQKNLKECVVCQAGELLCFFEDDTIKKVSISDCLDVQRMDKVFHNDSLFRTAKVTAGGYSITFNDSIDLPAGTLYQRGRAIPLKIEDFLNFARFNLLDTSQSCEVLQCSRQNIAYMVKQDQLRPVKKEVKGNLYLKSDVLKK